MIPVGPDGLEIVRTPEKVTPEKQTIEKETIQIPVKKDLVEMLMMMKVKHL